MNRPVNRRRFLKATGIAAISTCILPTRTEAGGYSLQGIPEGASDAVKELHNGNHLIKRIAFAPDDGWVIFCESSLSKWSGIPEGASDKLKELNEQGKLFEDISFTHDGGYIIFYRFLDQRFQSWTAKGVPSSLITRLRELDEQRSIVKHVAFTKGGGWVILYGFNGFAYKDIPDDAVDKLKELRKEYVPFKWIEFSGDEGWAIFYGDNAYSWSKIPSKAGERLTKWHDDGETFGSIAFSGDEGWVVLLEYETGIQHWETRANDGSREFPTIHAYVHNFGDIYDRNLIIGKALTAFHAQYRDRRVATNSYEISKNAYFINDDYWKLCNVEAHPRYGPRELLWYQLETLRLPNSAQEEDDEGPPFPELHLYPFNEDSAIWGHSYLNQVIVKYENDKTTRRTGDFSIFLNTWHVGEVGHGRDPLVWSMVIGHETLHNLGHEHGADNYTDGRQINCFHRAMFCNGHYDGRRNVPGFG